METALDVMTAVGGLGAGWFASRHLDPRKKRIGKPGSQVYLYSEIICASGILAAAIGGAIITRLVFLWLG